MSETKHDEILLVAPQGEFREVAERVLQQLALKWKSAFDIASARSSLEVELGIVLCGGFANARDGAGLLAEFLDSGNAAIRILAAATSGGKTMQDAINLSQVFRYISLPANPSEVASALREAIESREMRRKRLESEAAFRKSYADAWTELRSYRNNARFVAHDLKNPLSAMRFGLQLVQIEAGHSSRFFESVLSSIDRLSDLASSLSEKGPAEFGIGQCDLSSLLQEIVEIERFAAEGKGLSIRLDEIEGDCLGAIDEVAASRIFFNMLELARERCDANGIAASLKTLEDGRLETRIGFRDVCVGDFGRGWEVCEEVAKTSGAALERVVQDCGEVCFSLIVEPSEALPKFSQTVENSES